VSPCRRVPRVRGSLRGPVQGPDLSCWDQFLCLACPAQRTGRAPGYSSLPPVASPSSTNGGSAHRGAQHARPSNEVGLAESSPTFPGLIATGAGPLCDRNLRGRTRADGLRPDATVIDLVWRCPWATFRKRKGPVELHHAADLRGTSRPAVHHARRCTMSHLTPWVEAGANLRVRPGYLIRPLGPPAPGAGLFVTAASGTSVPVTSTRVPSTHHRGRLRSDHSALRLLQQAGYPDRLRRIRYFDRRAAQSGSSFLTNNLHTCPVDDRPASTSAGGRSNCSSSGLKQHLRIKPFFTGPPRMR